MKHATELIFSLSLFINALLFVPQAITILKEKTAQGVSSITFLGFFIIQCAIALYCIINKDYLLIVGYLLSMVTCGTVVYLIFFNKTKHRNEEISLDAILEQLPGHIYWKNKEGVFLGSNTKNWQEFGLKSLSEYRNKTDYDLFSKEQADKIRLVDQAIIRTGESAIVEEKVVTSQSGSCLYLSHKAPLRNRNNQIIGIVGVSLDITNAKKESTERLELLESVIALMPGHVYWIDHEGVYLGCNDIQAKSAGLASRKDIVGKRNKDLPWNLKAGILPETLDSVNREVMESGQSITVEEPATLQNGTKLVFLSNKVPIRKTNSEIVGMVGISIDITNLKKLENRLKIAKERAETADKLKMDFIHNMEHDIRTPFWGLLCLTKQLEEQEADPEKKKLLASCAKASQELFDYCSYMTDFSKNLEGDQPLLDKKFRIREVVDKVLAIEMPTAQFKKLSLFSSIGQDVPEILVGDSDRIQRIFLNLIGNSIKFTQVGHIKLSVLLAKHTEKQAILTCVIEDTGIGISQENQRYIYEKFTRGTPSNKGLYKGLGLGLYIVKHYMTDMGGEIDVVSEEGKGTTFTCTIPFDLPLLDRVVNKEPILILLVEPGSDLLLQQKELLQELNCIVDTAVNGKDTLALFSKEHYDLVFTAFTLPDMNAVTLIESLRLNEKQDQKTPIVVLATFNEKDEGNNIKEVGGTNLIAKPLKNPSTIKILHQYIARFEYNDNE